MQAARTGRYTAAMPSRAGPLPQVGGWQAANSVGHALPVGAGLPAMQTARTGRYTASMPSRASPLPQRFLASREFSWSCITYGSWFACDADGADWQVHCSDAIASKPAPTKVLGTPRIQLVMHYLWELACLRCRRRGLAGAPQRCHREQARSHMGGAGTPRIQLVMHYLRELACLRCRRRGLAGTS